MSLNEETELLAKIPLFANIDPSKRKLLAFTSNKLTFASGQNLFRQGDIGDSAYIIMSGKADVLIEGAKGEISIARLGKNELIGEIAILVDEPRSATVRVVTELTALEISKDTFLRLVAEFPEIGIEVMRELAHRLDRTTTRLGEVHNGRRYC